MFNLVSLLIGAGLFVAGQLTPAMKVCVSKEDLARRFLNNNPFVKSSGNKIFGKQAG